MSLLGVLALNLLFLLAGSGVLWGIRGWASWGEYAALGGVGYMSGLCAVCALATLVPIYGGGLSTAALLAIVGVVTLAGVAIGAVKRRPLPPRPRGWTRPTSPRQLPQLALMALAAGLLVSMFRVARIQPLTSWDAWAFWMPKAKAIYFFGGLDPSLFRSLWGQSYPLFVPVLGAMNFRFMGSADTTTLGVQWWLLALGLVWAAAGLLRRVAPTPLTWLFLALFLAVPELDKRLFERLADWPLDIFFALAACSLLAWIVSRESWLLAVYGLMVSGVLLTKREGQLLAVCLVVAGLVAGGLRTRRTWLAVAGIAVLAYLPVIPWRIWWTSRHLPSDTPRGGLVHATFANADKAPEAFHLVFRLLFDYHHWLATAPIAVVAALLCLGVADRRAATFFLVAFGLGFVGWAWENWAWSSPKYPITSNPAVNPTIRTVGSLVLLSIVAAPVLIGQLLAQREAEKVPAAIPASP